MPYVRDGTARGLPRWAMHAFGGAGWSSPLRLARQVKDLGTLAFGDFTSWYQRLLPPSGVRDLLSRCGYTGMNVFAASAFWHLWANDYWYPEGGLQPWIDRWVGRLEERGVRFLFKRTVVRLEQEGIRATAVVTHKGEHLEAREVVYCGDYRHAVHHLVGATRYPKRDIARLEATRHSDAMVSVYLGLDLSPDALREQLRTAHVFFFPTFDCQTAIDPRDPDAHRSAFIEVSSHGADDPAQRGSARSTVVLQAFTRHDWLHGWGTGLTGDPARESSTPPRPAEYRRLKRSVADQLVATFEKLMPSAAGRVAYLDVGTPQSAVRFTRNAFGGTCGFELNWRNFPFAHPLGPVATPLENFHVAGHFTAWPGAVPTAALSGKVAALRAHQSLRVGRGHAKTRTPSENLEGRSVASTATRGRR